MKAANLVAAGDATIETIAEGSGPSS